MAKDAIDNGGAGRAAKGANPSFRGTFLLAQEENLKKARIIGGSCDERKKDVNGKRTVLVERGSFGEANLPLPVPYERGMPSGVPLLL